MDIQSIKKELDKKITLFHGGDTEMTIDKIKFPGPRPECDFGRAFYLTPSPDIAEEWIRNSPTPVISQYELKYSEDAAIVLRDMDWVKVIVGFRTELYKVSFTRNIVIGAIANDRMFEALPLFMRQGIGGISDKMLFDCISLVKLGDQYALINNADGLEFQKSYILKGKMLQDAHQRHGERRRGMTKAIENIRRQRYENERFIEDYIREGGNGITF